MALTQFLRMDSYYHGILAATDLYSTTQPNQQDGTLHAKARLYSVNESTNMVMNACTAQAFKKPLFWYPGAFSQLPTTLQSMLNA